MIFIYKVGLKITANYLDEDTGFRFNMLNNFIGIFGVSHCTGGAGAKRLYLVGVHQMPVSFHALGKHADFFLADTVGFKYVKTQA